MLSNEGGRGRAGKWEPATKVCALVQESNPQPFGLYAGTLTIEQTGQDTQSITFFNK